MNYTSLVALVEDYTENSFTTDQMDSFIQSAESRIYNAVQLPAFRKNVTGVTTANVNYISLPTDFLSVFSLSVTDTLGGQTFLLNKDVNFVREAYPSATTTGLPKYYALFGPSISSERTLTALIGPTPDLAYDVELHYYHFPTSIVTATNTWLGDNFPTVLLYGTILESYTFLKGEPDTMALYRQRFDEAMMELKVLGDGKNRQDAYRSGQVKVQIP